MNNPEDKQYDLTPIKKHAWFTVEENLLNYFGDFDDVSVFGINQVGTQELYKFGVTPSLNVILCDEGNMVISSPEKLRNFELLITNYIKKNCKTL